MIIKKSILTSLMLGALFSYGSMCGISYDKTGKDNGTTTPFKMAQLDLSGKLIEQLKLQVNVDTLPKNNDDKQSKIDPLQLIQTIKQLNDGKKLTSEYCKDHPSHDPYYIQNNITDSLDNYTNHLDRPRTLWGYGSILLGALTLGSLYCNIKYGHVFTPISLLLTAGTIGGVRQTIHTNKARYQEAKKLHDSIKTEYDTYLNEYTQENKNVEMVTYRLGDKDIQQPNPRLSNHLQSQTYHSRICRLRTALNKLTQPQSLLKTVCGLANYKENDTITMVNMLHSFDHENPAFDEKHPDHENFKKIRHKKILQIQKSLSNNPCIKVN